MAESTTEIKFSNNPKVQDLVDNEVRKLHEKNPTSSLKAINEHARDRVAWQIRHTRLRQELDASKDMSTIDELTGLYNRKFLMVQIEKTINEAGRLGIPFSVVLMDIDGLKDVNDTFGHAAGDEVLKNAAQTYRSTFRQTDTITRLGGDEFAVILLGSKNGEAIKVADKSRLNIENSLKKTMGKKGRQTVNPVTQTVGVATYKKGLTASELLHRADIALYNGKKPNDGSTPKNRVVSYVEGMKMPTKQDKRLLEK